MNNYVEIPYETSKIYTHTILYTNTKIILFFSTSINNIELLKFCAERIY